MRGNYPKTFEPVIGFLFLCWLQFFNVIFLQQNELLGSYRCSRPSIQIEAIIRWRWHGVHQLHVRLQGGYRLHFSFSASHEATGCPGSGTCYFNSQFVCLRVHIGPSVHLLIHCVSVSMPKHWRIKPWACQSVGVGAPWRQRAMASACNYGTTIRFIGGSELVPRKSHRRLSSSARSFRSFSTARRVRTVG